MCHRFTMVLERHMLLYVVKTRSPWGWLSLYFYYHEYIQSGDGTKQYLINKSTLKW